MILNIKKKWFDMIRKGIKTEEYREIKPFYISRLPGWFRYTYLEKSERLVDLNMKHENDVILRNGYKKESPQITISCTLKIGEGKPEWGAEPGKKYFILDINGVSEEKKR